jgi:NAD(P)-dependent dehydrogenase (short-subunit alcohol dehydrogenase family)
MTRVLVTGSTDGIGLRTAQILADRGAEVVLHGRSPERVAQAQESVGAAATAALVADLSDLDQTADLAARVRDLGIDVLLNNAGVYRREQGFTGDGYEMMWGVNHLAPSLLTALLLPSLPDGGRVVFVSSQAHARGAIDLDDPSFERRRWNHNRAYSQSKLANLLMARAWAQRQDRVAFFALHPGVVATKLLIHGFGVEGRHSLDEGSATSVFAVLDPFLAGRSGAYLADSAIAEPAGVGRDDVTAAALFDFTMRTLGLSES